MQTQTETTTTISFGNPYNVILFNDNNHTTEEVTLQIIRAIRCSVDKATSIMMEAHTTGRAIVFTGHIERCEQITSVLEVIGLTVKIESI